MNYGGDAADQIVRYSLDGVDHGLRLSGTLAKHLAVFVAAVLKDQKKTRGKTRMVRMLKENKLYLTEAEHSKSVEALNQLRDTYLKNGRYSDGIDSVLLKIMKSRYRPYRGRGR